MSNFSWNNLINNFLKPELQDTLRNLQNSNNTNNTNNNTSIFKGNAEFVENAPNTQASVYNFNPQNAQTAKPQQNQAPLGEFLFNAQVSQMEPQQTTQMIKELFKLPKEISEFLKMASNMGKNNPIDELLGAVLDLTQLSSTMQENGKSALTKLFQIIAEYNRLGVTMKSQDITELAKLINTAIRNSTSTDVQTLKTVMLLYLPWLPLTDNEAFKLEITQKKEEETGDSEDSITLLITTVNYYNLQAAVVKNGNESVNVNVICSEEFPSSELKSGLEEKSVKFNVPINFESKVQENQPKEKNEERKMKIFMNTSPGVNPFLLLVANSVLNIVHKIDDMDTLREKRSQKI